MDCLLLQEERDWVRTNLQGKWKEPPFLAALTCCTFLHVTLVLLELIPIRELGLRFYLLALAPLTGHGLLFTINYV